MTFTVKGPHRLPAPAPMPPSSRAAGRDAADGRVQRLFSKCELPLTDSQRSAFAVSAPALKTLNGATGADLVAQLPGAKEQIQREQATLDARALALDGLDSRIAQADSKGKSEPEQAALGQLRTFVAEQRARLASATASLRVEGAALEHFERSVAPALAALVPATRDANDQVSAVQSELARVRAAVSGRSVPATVALDDARTRLLATLDAMTASALVDALAAVSDDAGASSVVGSVQEVASAKAALSGLQSASSEVLSELCAIGFARGNVVAAVGAQQTARLSEQLQALTAELSDPDAADAILVRTEALQTELRRAMDVDASERRAAQALIDAAESATTPEQLANLAQARGRLASVTVEGTSLSSSELVAAREQLDQAMTALVQTCGRVADARELAVESAAQAQLARDAAFADAVDGSEIVKEFWGPFLEALDVSSPGGNERFRELVFGDDGVALLNVLAPLSSSERVALRQRFEQRTGKSVDDVLAANLSAPGLGLARFLLTQPSREERSAWMRAELDEIATDASADAASALTTRYAELKLDTMQREYAQSADDGLVTMWVRTYDGTRPPPAALEQWHATIVAADDAASAFALASPSERAQREAELIERLSRAEEMGEVFAAMCTGGRLKQLADTLRTGAVMAAATAGSAASFPLLLQSSGSVGLSALGATAVGTGAGAELGAGLVAHEAVATSGLSGLADGKVVTESLDLALTAFGAAASTAAGMGVGAKLVAPADGALAKLLHFVRSNAAASAAQGTTTAVSGALSVATHAATGQADKARAELQALPWQVAQAALGSVLHGTIPSTGIKGYALDVGVGAMESVAWNVARGAPKSEGVVSSLVQSVIFGAAGVAGEQAARSEDIPAPARKLSAPAERPQPAAPQQRLAGAPPARTAYGDGVAAQSLAAGVTQAHVDTHLALGELGALLLSRPLRGGQAKRVLAAQSSMLNALEAPLRQRFAQSLAEAPVAASLTSQLAGLPTPMLARVVEVLSSPGAAERRIVVTQALTERLGAQPPRPSLDSPNEELRQRALYEVRVFDDAAKFFDDKAQANTYARRYLAVDGAGRASLVRLKELPTARARQVALDLVTRGTPPQTAVLERVMASPHSERGVIALGEARAAAQAAVAEGADPQRYDALLDEAVAFGATTPRLRKIVSTPTLASLEAVRAVDVLMRAAPAEHAQLVAILAGASPAERVYLLKAIGSRAQPLALSSPSQTRALAVAEVREFAQGIAGLAPSALAKMTSLRSFTLAKAKRHVDAGVTVGGGVQQFSTSCVPTSALVKLADADPVLAFRYRTRPELFTRDQHYMMASEGSVFSLRPQLRSPSSATAAATIDAHFLRMVEVLSMAKAKGVVSLHELHTFVQWQGRRGYTKRDEGARLEDVTELQGVYAKLKGELKSVGVGSLDAFLFYLARTTERDSMALPSVAANEDEGTLSQNVYDRWLGEAAGHEMHFDADLPNAAALYRRITRVGPVPLEVGLDGEMGHLMLVTEALQPQGGDWQFRVFDPADGIEFWVPGNQLLSGTLDIPNSVRVDVYSIGRPSAPTGYTREQLPSERVSPSALRQKQN